MEQLGAPIREAMRACKSHFLAAGVFSGLLNVLYLAPTLYMLQVYDRVVPARGSVTLLALTVALVLALATLALLDMVRSRLLVRASIRLDRQLSGAILHATLARPKAAREGLTKQALREFDLFRQTLTGVGVLAVFDAPWTPIYILVCLMIHPALGLLAFLGAAGLLALAWRNEQAVRRPLEAANAAANVAYVQQEFTASAADVIRALGMRRAIVNRHLAERLNVGELQAKANFAGAGYVTVTRFVRLCLQSLALGLGAWLAIENKISAGAIFAGSILIARALAPIEQVLGGWRNLVQARSAYRTLNALLENGPTEGQLTQLPAPKGALEAEHLVTFGSDRQNLILRDVSFRLAAGEAVGLVGPSGAGKSTLLRVLAGAASQDQGVVRIDGADVGDWDRERLARHIGYLPQEPMLFAGTVKENIARFSNHTEADIGRIDEMVMQTAQRCGVHDMILRLTDGYDTMIGWGGRGLSAGQAQRIALARAFYGNPVLLLLDEPNAHLDADGEAQLVSCLLDAKAAGATVLVAAHRTGVLTAVDTLMVLQEGRLEMVGPRDEVVSRLAGPVDRRSVVPSSTAA